MEQPLRDHASQGGETALTFLARAADEVEALPDGSTLTEMVAEYGVMREQAQGCGG